MNKIMQWSISIPVFKNPIIMKQLGIALGLSFGLMLVIFYISTGQLSDTLHLLGIVLFLFLLTYLFLMLVWRGKYNVEFIVDSKGIRCRTEKEQRRKNRVINSVTVILGLLTGKMTAAGAGMMAEARQDVLVKWKSIRKVRYIASQYAIMIKGGFAENIAVFCTSENYGEVEAFIDIKISGTDIKVRRH